MTGVCQWLVLLSIFLSDLGDGTECTLSKRAGDTSENCAATRRDLNRLEKCLTGTSCSSAKRNAEYWPREE